MNLINFSRENKIRYRIQDDKIWFMARSILPGKSGQSAYKLSKNIPNEHKQKIDDVIFIDYDGLVQIICRSRNPLTLKYCKDLNIETLGLKYIASETDCLHKLIKIFGELYECILQYPVLCYRIDLYVVDMKLAIECDEDHHLTTDQRKKDLARMNNIRNYLKCNFFRFKPDAKDFDFEKDVVSKLYKYFLKKEKEGGCLPRATSSNTMNDNNKHTNHHNVSPAPTGSLKWCLHNGTLTITKHYDNSPALTGSSNKQ